MVGKVGLERQVCEGNQQAVFLLVRFARLLFLHMNCFENNGAGQNDKGGV